MGFESQKLEILVTRTTFIVVIALFHPWLPRVWAQEDQVGLADLTLYRAALYGKGAGSPAKVHFRDLWDRSEAYRGRHVVVDGRVQRIFRQEPIGDFPALAEVWISSPAGDPFCLVFPLPGPVPDRGREVRFTGTFLKMVRYAAGDGGRLAPLVVGSRPPTSQSAGAVDPSKAVRDLNAMLDRWSWSPLNWFLGLSMAALAAGLLAWRHLHSPSKRVLDRGRAASEALDSPLEFIDPGDQFEA